MCIVQWTMNVLHEILKVKMWLFLPEKQVGQVLPGPYRYEPVPIFQDKERQNGENDLSKNFDETGDAEQYKRDLYVDKKGIFLQRLYQIFNPTVTEGGLLKPPPTKNYHISTFLWSNWAKKIWLFPAKVCKNGSFWYTNQFPRLFSSLEPFLCLKLGQNGP